MRTMFAGLMVMALGLVVAPPSFGQTFGEITGVVTDASAAVVVGATVTVTNTQTNAVRTASTNDVGNYSFPALLPGLYKVSAEMKGLQTEIRDGVQLQVQQTARLDFQLQIGSTTTAVTVSGGAPLVATEDATVGTVIDNHRIVDLPLNGRNFTALIALSPHVSAGFGASNATSRQGGERSTVAQIAVGGQRNTFTYYSIDGISNTDPNYNDYAFLPSIDALQEFKVQTGIYSAEFGRESTQVNISTKSGTNQYHGSAFDFVRNNFWDARPFGFTSKVPLSAPFKWNQFGYTLGGPVRIPKIFDGSNKLFFMTNYEGFREHYQTQAVYSTPPVAMRNGDFTQILPTLITDPLANNTPFPGNIIPSQRFSKAAVGMLQYYPAPNVVGARLTNNYLALDNNQIGKDLFLARIDFAESAKSNWYGRYSWQSEFTVTPALYLNGTSVATGISQEMISNARILGPSLVNEFRFGISNFNNRLAYQAPPGNPSVELGFGGFDSGPIAAGTPQINITGFSGFGDPTSGPWITHDHTFQWVDTVSWTHRNHSMTFGAEIRRDRYNNAGNQQSRGQYTVQNQATGYGMGDYMLGYINTMQDAGALGNGQFRATSQAYFINDSWKVRPNLTIDIGLRYEFVPPWSTKNDTEVNVWIPPGFPMSPPITGVVRTYTGPKPCFIRQGKGDFAANTLVVFNPAICTARDGRMGDRLIQADYHNFAPRLGIAWSPSSKLTVRTGAGRFYVQDINNIVWDLEANLAGHTVQNANIVTHDLTFEHPFSNQATACPQPTPPYICISTPQGLANQHDRRTAYVDEAELNIQFQLDSNTVMEVGYLGSESHFLQNMLSLNTPLNMDPKASVVSREPDPSFGNIQYVASEMNANYNAGSIKVTRRLSAGLTYLVGYTFSKSIDEGSGVRNLAGDGQLTVQNGTDFKGQNRGRSSFDATQRLVVSALYALPFGKGHKFLNHGIASTLLGGWQLGAINTLQTGLPFSIQAGVDQSNTGETHDLGSVVPGVSWKLPHPSTAQWFNTAAFALAPKGAYGNTGRNIVVGPRISTLNSTLQKNFNFTERTYLQMRLEAFNTLNHPNFALPAATIVTSGAAFGSITATTGGINMRELQISMKLVF